MAFSCFSGTKYQLTGLDDLSVTHLLALLGIVHYSVDNRFCTATSGRRLMNLESRRMVLRDCRETVVRRSRRTVICHSGLTHCGIIVTYYCYFSEINLSPPWQVTTVVMFVCLSVTVFVLVWLYSASQSCNYHFAKYFTLLSCRLIRRTTLQSIIQSINQ